MNGVPVRCASAGCSCGQKVLRRHMADWAPPEAHNRESSSNSFEKFSAVLLGSILLGDTGDVNARSGAPRIEPAGRGHRSQRHAAVGAMLSSKLFFNRSSTTSPLSLSSVPRSFRATRKSGLFCGFFRRSLTSTLLSGSKMFERKRASAPRGGQIRCLCRMKDARSS